MVLYSINPRNYYVRASLECPHWIQAKMSIRNVSQGLVVTRDDEAMKPNRFPDIDTIVTLPNGEIGIRCKR